MAEQQQTLSVPSLLLLAALSVFAVRYFFFSPTSASTRTSRSDRRSVNPADIEQIAQMFPQVPRRDIMWDLQRNGGSVAATTERILGRGGLDTPPPTFQPQIPAPATPSTSRATPTKSMPEQVDLIKRYNLTGKLSTAPLDQTEEDVGRRPGWSNNKNERQTLLQKRRDEMVLAARRKMEEKERGKASS